MTRCQCIVFCTKYLRNRNCKLDGKYKDYKYGNYYCKKHANVILSRYILMIQKCWKSYKTRLKISTLFINLPRDLQIKIIFHMSDSLYYKKLYNCICKIIYPKINTFIENINYTNILYERVVSIYEYLSDEELINFCYLCRIIVKYISILNTKKLKDFIHLANMIHINYLVLEVENTIFIHEWIPVIKHINLLKCI
jgi:hypothetical protein